MKERVLYHSIRFNVNHVILSEFMKIIKVSPPNL